MAPQVGFLATWQGEKACLKCPAPSFRRPPHLTCPSRGSQAHRPVSQPAKQSGQVAGEENAITSPLPYTPRVSLRSGRDRWPLLQTRVPTPLPATTQLHSATKCLSLASRLGSPGHLPSNKDAPLGWGVKGGTTDSQGVEEFPEGQISKPITDTVNVRQIFAVWAGLLEQLLNILKLQTLEQVKGGWEAPEPTSWGSTSPPKQFELRSEWRGWRSARLPS